MTKTTGHPTTPEDTPLTPEDVAFLADGTGNIPDDTATRLQALIRCDDPERIERIWCWIGAQLEELRQMADDACVEHLADGLYVFRCFERLRAEPWTLPSDVLDARLDVPYQELISLAGAFEGRAKGAEKVEMQKFIERIGAALGAQIQIEEQVAWMARQTNRKRQ